MKNEMISKTMLRFLTGFFLVVATMQASLGLAADQAGDTALRATAVRELVDKLEHQHYVAKPLDDQASSKLLDAYVNKLDPVRLFLQQSDIAEFEKYRSGLDDELHRGDMAAGVTIFRRYQQRTAERLQRIVDTLPAMVAAMKFDGDDFLDLDRGDKSTWPTNTAECDEVWRPRLKNTVLGLRLEGKSNDEIVAQLTKRYRRQLERLAKESDDDILTVYLNALVSLYDEHSSYFPPFETKNFDVNKSLKLVGIGLVLKSDENYAIVSRSVPGGPAAKQGGLMSGDRIVAVGEGSSGELQDVVGWLLDDVVNLMRGPRGSTVRLQVLPADAASQDRRKLIELVRDDVPIVEQRARKQVLELEQNGTKSHIAVIAVPALYVDFEGMRRGDKDFVSAARDVQKLVAEAMAENVQGIVLDLRDNGGGALQEANVLTGLFIDSGPVLQIRERNGKIFREGKPRSGPYYEGPLALLINRLSASGTEIVAGALQDYQRALILGDQSFGIGTVQQVVTLSYGTLKLTGSALYRVSGATMQLQGVTPDIVFPSMYDATQIGERNLKNPLPADQIATVSHKIYFDIPGAVPGLLVKHEQRVKDDGAFQRMQAQQVSRGYAPHRLSLNEAVRKRDLVAASQDPGSDTRPTSVQSKPDPLLTEAARVLIDALPTFTASNAAR